MFVRVMIRAFDGPRAVAKAEFPLGTTFGIFKTGRVGDGVILTTTSGIAELITWNMANSSAVKLEYVH